MVWPLDTFEKQSLCRLEVRTRQDGILVRLPWCWDSKGRRVCAGEETSEKRQKGAGRLDTMNLTSAAALQRWRGRAGDNDVARAGVVVSSAGRPTRGAGCITSLQLGEVRPDPGIRSYCLLGQTSDDSPIDARRCLVGVEFPAISSAVREVSSSHARCRLHG